VLKRLRAKLARMTPHEFVIWASSVGLRMIASAFGTAGIVCIYTFAISQDIKSIVMGTACMLVAVAVTLTTPAGK
jgi:hypothetical protein